MPAPKLFTSLPDESNLRMGSTVGESRHALLPPHRSATQMLLPSLSISTALSDPHFRPSGSWAQFSTVRYGFGASLVGDGPDCAATSTRASAIVRIRFLSLLPASRRLDADAHVYVRPTTLEAAASITRRV